MTTVFLWTTIATALDSDLTFMTGAPLIVTLVEWTCGGLSNIDVLKVSEDTQPRRTIIINKHRPQAMPAVTLPELEHDAKVCLIPGRLFRSPGIKRLVTHCNRGTSLDGQANVSLAPAFREYPV